MNLKKYITELKRRNVFKVAIAYLVVAWLIAQVASIFLPTFNAPPYIMKTLLFILIIGFPINLILAWVYDVTPDGIKKTDVNEQNTSSSIQKSNRLNIIIISSLVMVIILLIFNQSSNNQVKESSNIINDQKTIAVLPLINISEGNSQDYFSDGVTQEIIDELAKVNTFIITAFSTTYQYKKKEVPHIDIAKNLNVKYLISGSSRVFKDSVRLSIELFNPHTNERIWNGSYNEVMKNAASIQLSIAKQVAKSLNVKLTSDEKKSLDTANTIDGEAFNYFLKAKAELTSLTQEGFLNSIDMLRRAIDLDPDYSQAYTLLAWSSLLKSGAWFGGDESSSETLRIISPYIEKSISLNPKSSDIYLVRANLNLFTQGLLGNAKKDVEYALALNSWPKTPTTYCICTIVSTYLALGDLQKAKKYANLGREIDPGNVFIWFDRANIHMMEGELQKAQAIYEEALQVMNIPFTQFFVGWSYYHDKQFSKALPYLENAYKSDAFNFVVAYLSNTHFMLGDQTEADRYQNELEQRMTSGKNNLDMSMAMIAAAQSDSAETLTWLEKAQEKNESIFAYMVNVDPIFKPLYEEPRFKEIRRKMQYYE